MAGGNDVHPSFSFRGQKMIPITKYISSTAKAKLVTVGVHNMQANFVNTIAAGVCNTRLGCRWV